MLQGNPVPGLSLGVEGPLLLPVASMVLPDNMPAVLQALPGSKHLILRNGVAPGSIFPTRQHCRQWGIHMPPIAGIAGQNDNGAQSITVSGRCEYLSSLQSLARL